MQFEYDPERLIEEVKKRPGIWNYDDADYRARNMRFKLWSEIVTELIQPEVKITKSEMRELEIQLQKKWKGIRDCFQKYIANPNRTKRPYIYCKQLQFLLKNELQVEKGDGDNSSESDMVLVKARKAWRTKKKLKIVKDEEQSSEEDATYLDTLDDSRDYSNDESEPSRSKIAKLDKSHTDEFAFANVDVQTKADVEDPDKMFLLSLLPHLKTIPEDFRLNVKMELMQVLRNANYHTARDHKII